MGLLDQIGGMLNNAGGGGNGGGNPLDRFLKGNADYSNPQDAQHFGQVTRGVSQDQLSAALSHAAGNMDHDQYRQHITPGVGGTNPLGGLKGAAMTMVAGALMRHIMGGSSGGGGGGGGGGIGSVIGGLMGGNSGQGGGGGASSLLGMIPGLKTTDPNQMDESQVAALASYAKQHHPDAFGKAAAEVGQQNPDVLSSLLGNQGMSAVAKGLMGQFMGGGRH
jgi:hypothetical protein